MLARELSNFVKLNLHCIKIFVYFAETINSMRTYYDCRSNLDYKNPENNYRNPVQAYKIIQIKNYSLLYIPDANTPFKHSSLKGWLVTSNRLFIYHAYLATSFLDAVKYLFKTKKKC